MTTAPRSPAATGRLPWTGSARRARDLGYAEAMRDVAELAEDLLHGVHDDPAGERLLPLDALEAIRSYAFDVSRCTPRPA